MSKRFDSSGHPDWQELAANPLLGGPFESVAAMPFGKRCFFVGMITASIVTSLIAIGWAFYFNAQREKLSAQSRVQSFLSSFRGGRATWPPGTRVSTQFRRSWEELELRFGKLESYRLDRSLIDLAGTVCNVQYSAVRTRASTKGDIVLVGGKLSTVTEKPTGAQRSN